MLIHDPPKLATQARPSWRTALGILVCVRVLIACVMIISDCDEVYNYWEPVHLLSASTTPKAFETWEYAPQYAIRSWAYITLHAIVPGSLAHLPSYVSFYALRVVLAIASSFADAFLYERVAQFVHVRIARYMLVFLVACAGMHSASVALLPSSMVMYTTSVGMAYAMQPASMAASRRTYRATAAFAFGALCSGWPYALVLAVPFVLEELCGAPLGRRLARGCSAALLSALCVGVPTVLIDSLAYGRPTLVALQTILYNVASRARGIGPELYGVEPTSYYFVALALGFSVAAPMALVSLPMLALAARYLPSRVAGSAVQLGLRLAPLYLWLAVLFVQPHKEERFLYAAYPLVCFAAAVTLYLVRAFLESAYLRFTRSPYRASRTMLFSAVTLVPLLAAAVLGVLRTSALILYYRAPIDIMHALPNEAGTLCYAGEWHRFPSHFFVPPQVRVEFVESAFRGILPHHFRRGNASDPLWPWAAYTRTSPTHVNDRNAHEPDRYVALSQCSWLVDTHAADDTWEPLMCRPFVDNEASRLAAQTWPLPAKIRATVARALYVPGWDDSLVWRSYCLLRRRA